MTAAADTPPAPGLDAVGFIGLGAMGAPMAANLLAAGFAVRGYDTRTDATQRLSSAGGNAAASAREAASGADALVLMVVDAAQARAVLFDDGALDALAPDGLVLLMSTCPPGEVEAMASAVEAAGRAFVDCPVSGGVAGARAASLTIMAAGSLPAFERATPLLEAMGGTVVHVGERPGQGAAVKSINQLLCGVHLAAAAEALTLAAKAGVDRATLLGVVGGSAASSWMLRDRGPRMLEADPEVTSAVDIFVKDLGIVLAAGREAKAALPLAATAHQLFLAVSGAGDGAADDSQVIRAYARLNGLG